MSRHQNAVKIFLTSTICLSAVAAFPLNAMAQSNKVSTSSGLLQIVAALAFVIFLLLALAWLFKRVGPLSHSQQLPMKVIGGLSLGHREKLIVVEVADQWLVLGVTAQQITKLSELQKQELVTSEQPQLQQNVFADWLKKTIDKRNATTKQESP